MTFKPGRNMQYHAAAVMLLTRKPRTEIELLELSGRGVTSGSLQSIAMWLRALEAEGLVRIHPTERGPRKGAGFQPRLWEWIA